MRILIRFAAVFVTACATAPQELNPKVYYKKDMNLTVNGKSFTGIGVVPRAESYDISIESRADVDMFSITTCHRDVAVESVIKQGWFKRKRGYTYKYTPTSIEQEPNCLVDIGGLEKTKGRHSWAMIDFADAENTLPARVACNGEKEYTSPGVTICQSREGLEQSFIFESPTLVATNPDKKCVITSKDQKKFVTLTPNRECRFVFREISGKRRFHRLLTIGFEETPIRGE